MSARAADAARRQRGLSLLELMVAMLLGLIVVAAVFNIYVGTSKSQRFTSGLMALQEDGRFGLSTLQRGLRLAGFSEALDFDAIDLARSDGSRITVRAQQPFDCNGADTAATGGVAENTYAHVAADETITCGGNVLVENVEAFRVLYGLDTGTDGTPDRFVPHAAAAAAGVDRVVALRFAMLVNSGDTSVRSRDRALTHVVLDTLQSRDDRRVREVFSSTVKLRNR